ncbi:hypothetical protein ABW20_dc0106620 [Dactylellina cionopaga]|nr:hypothetical protein ABW20_dc0106620 [Dactylellina cionopaga]
MAIRTIALPYDVLCVVANFISSHRDLLSFCLANRETRDAGLPFLYRHIFFESWPDARPENSTGSGDWYRVGDPTETLFSILYKDLQNVPGRQKRAIHVKSLRHLIIPDDSERKNDRTQDMAKNQLVYLVETLPRLEKLEVSIGDLTLLGLESAISTSPISHLHITPHRLLTYSCDSRRLAQSTPRFLPLWGNIASTNLKSLTITDLLPSSRQHLDRYTIPGSVEIWCMISQCPNLKRLDVRVKINGRDRGHNYINDYTGRAIHGAGGTNVIDDTTDGPTVASPPVVHLEALRLENCTVSSFEFNRLGPLSLKELHIPFNGRKRLFRDLGSVNALTGGQSMVFPKNMKSMVVDNLPLAPDRKEPWQQIFEQSFKELRLEELVVLTKKADFWVQSTNNNITGGGWVSRGGEDLSLNTRNEAVGMITGGWGMRTGQGRSRQASTSTAGANTAIPVPVVASATPLSPGGITSSSVSQPALDLGDSQLLEPGMGCWLKRLLLKGSWQMTKGLLDNLLSTCWGLEELGVALLWRDWEHDVSTLPPYLKRLRNLRTLIILNEPQSKNMNAEWGSPLPTKNKIWGNKMELDDDRFIQFGQPQERLRHFGIGKKMWTVVLEEFEEPLSGRRYHRRGSGSKSENLSSGEERRKRRRTLREADREGINGVGILDWIRFCDECWIGDITDKTVG